MKKDTKRINEVLRWKVIFLALFAIVGFLFSFVISVLALAIGIVIQESFLVIAGIVLLLVNWAGINYLSQRMSKAFPDENH